MIFFVPKSYLIRHKVLEFLFVERKKIDVKENDVFKCSYTVSQIAANLNIDRGLVDEQVDVLYHLKQIEVIRHDVDDNKVFINPAGMYAYSLKSSLNDGQILNSQLFNNYSSGIFQIITGIIALFSVYVNFTSIDSLKLRVESIDKELANIKLSQAKSYRVVEHQNHTSDKKKGYQTNVQKSSSKLDTLK